LTRELYYRILRAAGGRFIQRAKWRQIMGDMQRDFDIGESYFRNLLWKRLYRHGLADQMVGGLRGHGGARIHVFEEGLEMTPSELVDWFGDHMPAPFGAQMVAARIMVDEGSDPRDLDIYVWDRRRKVRRYIDTYRVMPIWRWRDHVRQFGAERRTE